MAIQSGYYLEPVHNVAAGSVLSLLATVAVCLRFWTRIKYQQGLQADDWTILPAVLFTLGQGINIVYGVAKKALATRVLLPPGPVTGGFAAHTDQVLLMSKLKLAFVLMLPLAAGCIKLSFLFFYVRIFVVNKRRPIHIMLLTVIAIVALWIAVCFLLTIFECRLDFWALWAPPSDIFEKCIDTFKAVYAMCLSDFLTDLLVIIIPVPLIWNLKMSTQKKIATSAVFLLGIVAIAASLTRLIMTVQVIQHGFDADADVILTMTSYLYWGMVECALGVVAACLPSLAILGKGFSLQSAWASVFRRWSRRRADASAVRSSDQEYKSQGSFRPLPPLKKMNGSSDTSWFSSKGSQESEDQVQDV
ncbi:hypothetical protein XA68_15381 [Ophiocordyceps unilateralis]|uniref:Rhodopsin domain-containing protein n=1 Tax=Ophiocordyceps unilateralis TaxID=268505 RepID=A0A2A9P888_OPHUN|nr:hypothetical protein XA68_15381 [Ophiocordyceps unilateralis]